MASIAELTSGTAESRMTSKAGNLWPDDAAGDVVFLLDCRGATEKKILLRGIDEHRPKDARIEVIDAGLSRRDVMRKQIDGLGVDLASHAQWLGKTASNNFTEV